MRSNEAIKIGNESHFLKQTFKPFRQEGKRTKKKLKEFDNKRKGMVTMFQTNGEIFPGARWSGSEKRRVTSMSDLAEAAKNIRKPLFVLSEGSALFVSHEGSVTCHEGPAIAAWAPESRAERLGDPSFCEEYGIRYPYVGGSMAKGICSVETVSALGRCGALGFFGAGGLSIPAISDAVDRLLAEGRPFGANLIHNPSDYRAEKETADLYLKKGLRLIEASAYIDLTPAVVKFALKGVRRDESGKAARMNRIIAKASRIEVAEKFLSPARDSIIDQLLSNGEITAEEARIGREIPVACDVTAEADSGGHTDNRPAPALLSSFMELRSKMQKRSGERLRIGFGGGIGTPAAAAAAFAAGSAYIVTGSVNQSCVESGVSDTAKEMLAAASQADTAMAPSADMFEIGAKVQVLKKGTMFAMRAQKLWSLYNSCSRIEDIPAKDLAMIEKSMLKCSIGECWESTKRFFEKSAPEKIEKAEADPRFKMALIFRAYLGQAAGWAVKGVPERKIDFQIWTGPAIGAFNEWCKGTFMESHSGRRTDLTALNLLYGAAVLTRLSLLRQQGIDLFAETELKPARNIAELL